MSTHPLDNPMWSSLATRHRSLALEAGGVLRYPADIAPFMGVEGGGPLDPRALEALVPPGDTVFMLGPEARPPAGWALENLGTIVQMVSERRIVGGASPAIDAPDAGQIVPLLEAHRPAVLELTTLVYPHYFRPRTTVLGRYFGMLDAGHLAAMAGERMGVPGYRELSAICTHPDFVGQGRARRLLAHLTNDVWAMGLTPFLHVSPANTRARQLYEQNGYRTRVELPFWALRRT